MLIRRATRADLEAITGIYNEVISNSDAIYREAPVPVSERMEWFEAKVRDGDSDARTIVCISDMIQQHQRVCLDDNAHILKN